jgi:HK97 family phage portal protein
MKPSDLFKWLHRKRTVAERSVEIDTFTLPPVPRQIGLSDTYEPDSEQIRTAYRGLVYRLAQVRSDAIASALMQLTVERPTGQGEFRIVEPTHPWVTLLQRPNPNHSTRKLWKLTSLLRDLQGRIDFLIERGARNVPIALHPVFPIYGELRPVPNTIGGVDQYIFARADGKMIPFPVEDVVRIQHVNPITPFESASLLKAAAYEIDVDLYMKVYRRDMIKDGGLNATVLTSDQEITKPQAKQYGEEFKNKFLGIKGIKEVAVMGKGLKPHNVGVTAKDLEFIEGARLNTTDLLNIFGVPEGMISDSANRANADTSRLTFYQNTVQPEAELIADELTLSLERAFGAKPNALRVRVPDLAPLDHDFELRKDTSMVAGGLRTINEVRKENGDDPVDGGDEILVPSTLTPLSKLTKEPEPNNNTQEVNDAAQNQQGSQAAE